MSKIYEVKSEENWFIGKWEGFNYLTCFGDDSTYEQSQDVFHSILKSLDVTGLQVHVVSMSSDLQLVTFLVDTINQEKNRQIEVTQHQGAILLTETGNLLAVHLPKGGVSSQDFFGSNSGVGFGDSILIATRNEGKTKEFRKMFDKLGIKVENLNDYPDLPEVAETGMTFEENARLKAETISELTGKMVLSDDSGLKVDVLGGLPGVWSARFSGPDATDEMNNAKLLHELAMVFDKENRSAQFHTTLVVAAPGKDSLVVEADWDGYIGTELKGENGFGYDPLFIVGEGSKTAAELSADEKNEISHRGLALKKLMEVFPAWQTTH
ncbi:non-canonical purine NTP pyrophosphatase (RdgB/HAM1 family) [Streptococcus loxodontisalivarius]|uniref:dITP/XTP pyrophosphatase n=2 Tax=Streptococcus loxodontisalivarius TaxID=1349415 RepID=A0ABS2PR03_9STRE|nr:non-canonical purine NTP pyrophosphatase (RdgB/HAM1 family) [Streptococcus loxodontisalivarius]